MPPRRRPYELFAAVGEELAMLDTRPLPLAEGLISRRISLAATLHYYFSMKCHKIEDMPWPLQVGNI